MTLGEHRRVPQDEGPIKEGSTTLGSWIFDVENPISYHVIKKCDFAFYLFPPFRDISQVLHDTDHGNLAEGLDRLSIW